MSMYATIELDEWGHQDLPREFDPKGEGLAYGQNLGQCDGFDQLDAICSEAGVEPLSNFLDDSEMLDEADYEEMGLEPPEAKWAPIEDGVATLSALVADLEKRPAEARIGRYAASDVLWDLRASLAILQNAKRPNELFRFTVG